MRVVLTDFPISLILTLEQLPLESFAIDSVRKAYRSDVCFGAPFGKILGKPFLAHRRNRVRRSCVSTRKGTRILVSLTH